MVYKIESKCIIWSGSKDGKGYGMVILRGRSFKVHRLSYRLFTGSLGNLHVLHKCDNPSCYNPEHLFLGTNSDNQQDSVKKKRHWSSRKTVCKHGHSLVGENAYQRPGTTWRECKICQRENVRRLRRKNEG